MKKQINVNKIENSLNDKVLFTHRAFITKADLMLGNFIIQTNLKFNIVLFAFFSFFLSYLQTSDKFNITGNFEIVYFLVGVVVYFTSMIIFTGLFGVMMVVFGVYGKKGVLGEHIFVFKEKEFVEKTNYNESSLVYASMCQVILRFGSIYIRVPGGQWHFLPSRDFSSEEKKQELYNFLKNVIN